MQEFNYDLSKLEDPSEEIRLLKLFPSEVWESPLQCNLVTTVLRERSVPFRAVSYVWGDDPTTNHAIHVFPGSLDKPEPAEETRGFIPITFSLDEALRHIRSPQDTTTLWIDQICTHQADNAERAHQVKLMGQLYATATQVLVWLGRAQDESDAVMSAWQAVGQETRDWGMESYYTRERHHLLPPKMDNDDPEDEDTRKLQGILARAAELFAPLLRAGTLKAWFDRAWFSRLWVVQEFCMCPDTVFVCGHKKVAVELVMLAMQVLHSAISNMKCPTGRFSILQPPSVPEPRLWEVSDEPTGKLFSCRQRRQRFARGELGAKGDRLHVLLRKLFVEHDTRATRHRDRIYGLLGLAVDSKELDIRVDYTRGQTPRILTQTARAMIEIGGRVDILCYSQFPKAEELEGLPSWVPDWSGKLRASYYSIHEELESHRYTACGKSTVAVVKLPEGNDDILALEGYLVDTIERAADDVWSDMGWDPVRYLTYISQFDELYRLSMEKEEPIHGGEGISEHRKQEARWRVPIGDMYWTRQEESRRATPVVAVEHGRCVDNVYEFQIMSLLAGAELEERYAAWEKRYNAGLTGADYRESMTIMKGKRPFLTQMGYLGMGPAETAPGDAVAIFCGGRIPFVLRPKPGADNVWSFVGEAYCDGVMDGQIVDRRTKEVFHLA